MRHLRRVCSAILLIFSVIFGVNAQDFTLPGYIAVLGGDYNVYVVGSEFTTPTALTNNASPTRHYQFPTWSTDGRLAFFCCDLRFSPQILLEVYVASQDLTAAKLMYQAQSEGYTYSYWSPANCTEGDACRDLAVLVTRPNDSFKVEVLRQNAQGVTTRTIGTGAPFYFSWNSDGQQMVWHRNNRLLSFFDVLTNTIIDDGATPSFFQAPAWSPVDDRAAVVIEDSPSSSALVIFEAGQQRVLKGNLRGITNFSWSPDGRYIAYRLLTQDGITAIEVLDADSGAIVTSSPSSSAIAFFWSPDSTRLAYLTPELSGGASGGQFIAYTQVVQPERIMVSWNVLDIATGNSRQISSFTPTESMVYLLGYFDQFNQSHNLWSPDSRYLVYGEVVDYSTSATSVSFVDTLADTPMPVSIMPGEIGIWSYNERSDAQ